MSQKRKIIGTGRPTATHAKIMTSRRIQAKQVLDLSHRYQQETHFVMKQIKCQQVAIHKRWVVQLTVQSFL